MREKKCMKTILNLPFENRVKCFGKLLSLNFFSIQFWLAYQTCNVALTIRHYSFSCYAQQEFFSIFLIEIVKNKFVCCSFSICSQSWSIMIDVRRRVEWVEKNTRKKNIYLYQKCHLNWCCEAPHETAQVCYICLVTRRNYCSTNGKMISLWGIRYNE